MQEAAELTGGKAFAARDGEALLGVCREIDRLERRPIQSFRYQRYRDVHTPFGLAAVLFLLAGRLLDTTAGRRIP